MLAWLILTGTAVYELLTSGRHPATLAVALVGAAVHAGIFVWLAFSHRPGRHAAASPPTLPIVLLAVIGVGLAVVSPSALLFVFVAAAVGALYLPPTVAAGWIAAGAVVGFAFELQDSSLLSAVGDSVQLAAIGFFCYGWARMEETNTALEAAREEVGRLAVADERVRHESPSDLPIAEPCRFGQLRLNDACDSGGHDRVRVGSAGNKPAESDGEPMRLVPRVHRLLQPLSKSSHRRHRENIA